MKSKSSSEMRKMMSSKSMQDAQWREHWLFCVCSTSLLALIGLVLGRFSIGFLASAVLQLISGGYPGLTDEVIEVLTGNLSFLMILLLLFFFVRKKGEKRFSVLCFPKEHWKFGWLALGVTVGGMLCFGCIAVAVWLGGVQLSYRSFDGVVIGLALLAAFCQAATEEILFRGYLLNTLQKNYSAPVSILLCGFVFSLTHLLNPGVGVIAILNICVIGVTLSCIAWKRKSLDVVIGLHFMWNFMEQIVCGTPNSGIVFSKSIFTLAAGEDSLFYDMRFGVEAAVQTFLFWGSVLLITLFLERNGAKRRTLN